MDRWVRFRAMSVAIAVGVATVAPQLDSVLSRRNRVDLRIAQQLNAAFDRADPRGSAERHRRAADAAQSLFARRRDLRIEFASHGLDIARFAAWASTSNDADSAWLARDRALYRAILRSAGRALPPEDSLAELAEYAGVDRRSPPAIGAALVPLANVLTGRARSGQAFRRAGRFDPERSIAWAAALPASDANYRELSPYQSTFELLLTQVAAER